MPVEFITREITEFILLPIRHICLLNDLFQSANIENNIDWNIIQSKIYLQKKRILIFNGLFHFRYKISIKTSELYSSIGNITNYCSSMYR